MDKNIWNKHVQDHAPSFGAFLQSWQWGDFQHALGRRVERVFHKDENGVTLAQAVQMVLPAGLFYWNIPKGPLGTASLEKMVEVLRHELEDGLFFRVEPGERSRMQQVGEMQPAHTVVLDLQKGETEILEKMKSKTRYNIRLAERKGVISKFVGIEYFDDFMRLTDQTSTRDHITSHSAIYYKTLLETIQDEGARAFLAIAEYEGRTVAANIILDFGESRTYLYGATSNLHRNVMAQYALHHFLIKDAIQKGFKTFDFWGIAPEGADSSHPWFGITRYKMGFGGDVLEMPGTYEIPTKHVMYAVYRMAKKIRR